jgi:hypothetical protein
MNIEIELKRPKLYRASSDGHEFKLEDHTTCICNMCKPNHWTNVIKKYLRYIFCCEKYY